MQRIANAHAVFAAEPTGLLTEAPRHRAAVRGFLKGAVAAGPHAGPGPGRAGWWRQERTTFWLRRKPIRASSGDHAHQPGEGLAPTYGQERAGMSGWPGWRLRALCEVQGAHLLQDRGWPTYVGGQADERSTLAVVLGMHKVPPLRANARKCTHGRRMSRPARTAHGRPGRTPGQAMCRAGQCCMPPVLPCSCKGSPCPLTLRGSIEDETFGELPVAQRKRVNSACQGLESVIHACLHAWTRSYIGLMPKPDGHHVQRYIGESPPVSRSACHHMIQDSAINKACNWQLVAKTCPELT